MSNLEKLLTTRAWRRANADKIRRYNHEYAKRNPDKIKMFNKTWARNNPDKARASRLAAQKRYQQAHPDRLRAKEFSARLRRFGLTSHEYDGMLQMQGNGCGICGSKDPGQHRKRFSLDHCHQTGRFRGLLCSRCNLLLGQFADNPELLRHAADYLEIAS